MATIQALNTMASQLATIDNQHLGQDGAGAINAKTHSWGGRVVSTVQAQHNTTVADANRAVMNSLINTIRTTEGMGDRFASIAAQKFGKMLTDGKPISGRQAAQVLRDVVAQHTDEASARKENIKLNAQSLVAFLTKPGEGGAPPPFTAKMAEKMALYGMPGAMPNPDKVKEAMDSLGPKLTAMGLANGHSPTMDEAGPILDETCRMAALQAAKKEIRALAFDNNQMLRVFAGVAEDRGHPMPPDVTSYKERLFTKLMAIGMNDRQNMHIPTQAEVTASISSMANKLYDCLDTVEASNLPQAQGTMVKEHILASPQPITPAMATAICENVQNSVNLYSVLLRPGADKNELHVALNQLTASLDTSTLDPEGENHELREGIAGVDEVNTIRHTACAVALQILGISSDNAAVLFENKTFISPYHGLTSLRAELSQGNDMMSGLKERVLSEATLTLADHAKLDQNTIKAQFAPANLSQLNMADLRAQVPLEQNMRSHAMGALQLDGLPNLASMRIALQAELQADFAKPRANESILPAGASQHLNETAAHFSIGFLKDFFRDGLRVNGSYIPRSGTQDPAAMETQLNALVAQFPSAEVAGKITAGLFQNIEGMAQQILFQSPEVGNTMFEMQNIPTERLTNHAEHSLQSQPDGSYLFTSEYHFQKGASPSPTSADGLNTRFSAELRLYPPTPGGVAVTNTQFDFIFHK